jgi:hypothetical protein
VPTRERVQLSRLRKDGWQGSLSYLAKDLVDNHYVLVDQDDQGTWWWGVYWRNLQPDPDGFLEELVADGFANTLEEAIRDFETNWVSHVIDEEADLLELLMVV